MRVDIKDNLDMAWCFPSFFSKDGCVSMVAKGKQIMYRMVLKQNNHSCSERNSK